MSANARSPVLIHWTVSSYSGWGVYGLNLALAWAGDPVLDPVCSRRLLADQIEVDPLRRRAIMPFLNATFAFHERLKTQAGGRVEVMHPMLAAVNGDFTVPLGAHDVAMRGRPTIAVTFFEPARLSEAAVANAKSYPLIVAGSTWNARILAAHGVGGVTTVLQGIDPTLFHPGPRAGLLRDRFCVFSGGKLEYRKGQDIALAAFARFARRHPQALLVAAWHNPWPELARSLAASTVAPVLPFRSDGLPDAAEWARAAGISPSQFLDLGAVANAHMPRVLREMDVGLFANRCEGGTNLVAMECMACGVPAILSANTGHLDLIADDNCFPLLAQAPLGGIRAGIAGVAGWGESSVDEAEAALERVHADRAEAARRGARGAATVGQMTWARTAASTREIVIASMPG
jgi:glycosyltransferase involved in cell wall biosynthesis